MPPGAIEQQDGVRAPGDRTGDFLEVELHGLRVGTSPSLRRRLPPQHSHAVGGSITTRSRGR
jgi:hypothetical protein